MNMILVDVHCHLNHDRFKNDLDDVIKRARQAGVKMIITAGVNTPTNREVLKIAEKYKDIVKCSLGIYPIDALGIKIEALDEVGLTRQPVPMDIDEELEFIAKNKNKIIAVGECGLDFKYLKEHAVKQKENFFKVISAVEKLKKPIIVHSRSAEKEAIEMLESSKLKKVVMHCFGGNKGLIKRAADNGLYFSIPPVIARLQHFEVVAEIVNINRLLTETDAPWLSPYPGKRNEPAFVIESIKKIAKVKKMTEEETANNVYMNFQKLFNS